MPPLRHSRRSRRPHLTPPDYHRPEPVPPSPSVCTTTSANSPPAALTHLPFTPGSSHTRNRKEGHIPRPPNAFMVFRSWLWNKDNLKSIERDNRNVSRIAGRYWNELSEAERAPFRSMADEAKARHAQLYPQYRYSPASQKKPKIPQRRCQRTTDAENDKCKKLADLLLGGITSRDLAKYLGEPHKESQPEQYPFVLVPEAPSLPPPGLEHSPQQLRFKTDKSPLPPPLVSVPPPQYTALPVLQPSDEAHMTTPAISMFAHTPVPVYPPDDVPGFVATDDIPHLSLDNCSDPMIGQCEVDDLSSLLPPHMGPGAHTVLSGVKPEATSFVDSYVLGAHTTDSLVMPTPVFTDFEIGLYPSSEAPLVPLGSPMFTNPFELSTPTAEHSALLGTLDQLFGQPISPLTPAFPTDIW